MRLGAADCQPTSVEIGLQLIDTIEMPEEVHRSGLAADAEAGGGVCGIERDVDFATERGDDIKVRPDRRIDNRQKNCGNDQCSQRARRNVGTILDCTKIEAIRRKWQAV